MKPLPEIRLAPTRPPLDARPLERRVGLIILATAIGRPVVTSNEATAWTCLRLCGDGTPRPEFGRLMTLSLN